MSKIDLNKVFDVLGEPEPQHVLTLDGQDYKLKPLTMLDVASFDSLRTKAEGETHEQHLDRVLDRYRQLFDGAPPPFLSDPLPQEPAARIAFRQKVTVLSTIIATFITEASGNRLARAQQEAYRQIGASRAIGLD